MTDPDLDQSAVPIADDLFTWPAEAPALIAGQAADGTYVFPYKITLSTNVRYFTGQPVLKNVQLRGLNQGNVTVLAEPRGRTRLDDVTLWDVRVSKVVRSGRRELEVMVDAFNLLNQSAKTAINTNVGPLFGRPISILPPRIARLGARLSF